VRPSEVLRRQWATILLAVIGAGIVTGALFLYPRPAAVYRPAFYGADVFLAQSANQVEISVTQSLHSPNLYVVTIVATPISSFSKSSPAQANEVLLYLPKGIDVVSCSTCFIETRNVSAGPFASVIALRPASLTAQEIGFDVTLWSKSFAWDDNGVDVEAQLPQVALFPPTLPTMPSNCPSTQPNCSSTALLVQYRIPNVRTYDWTNGPLGTTSTWLVANAYQSSAGSGDFFNVPAGSSGVNNAATKADNEKTFAAGALLGIAGGALIGAIQEAISVERRNRASERVRVD
jgi:hypothetical protein